MNYIKSTTNLKIIFLKVRKSFFDSHTNVTTYAHNKLMYGTHNGEGAYYNSTLVAKWEVHISQAQINNSYYMHNSLKYTKII